MSLNKKRKGFTFMELLIVIAILIMTSLAVFTVQGRFLMDTMLDTNTDKVVQALNMAQMRSITRFRDSTWGVYFDSNNKKITLFKGVDYVSRDISFDQETDITASLSISDISFNGGGNEIVFNKLTGSTSQYGSLTLYDQISESSVITVNSKGLLALTSDGGGEAPPTDTQADDLVVDYSNVYLTNRNKRLILFL